MTPIVDGLEAEFTGQVSFLRLNAGEVGNQELMAEYDVVGHPAFIVIDSEGVVVQRLNGVQTEATLRKAISILTTEGDNS